jgi:hypothetical protein
LSLCAQIKSRMAWHGHRVDESRQPWRAHGHVHDGAPECPCTAISTTVHPSAHGVRCRVKHSGGGAEQGVSRGLTEERSDGRTGPTTGVRRLLRCEGGVTSGISMSSVGATTNRESWTRDVGAEVRPRSGSYIRHGRKRLRSIVFRI